MRTEVYSKALDQSISIERFIGDIQGSQPGPSLIITAGLHGNEPAGVFALHRVINFLKKEEITLRGNIYALSGNLWALKRGERYHKQDLNRLWTNERVKKIKSETLIAEDEDTDEQLELYRYIKEILEKDQGPFYFSDLHTTSCETIPFVVMNDSMVNRKFTIQYPLPIILGIEEYLEGPLLSYINELGYVAFGFEAGQHDDLSSIENHQAFIILSLVFTGIIDRNDIDFNTFYGVLARHTLNKIDFYEIFYRYRIKETEKFEMEPGYVNFQFVKTGEKLATSNDTPIYADRDARVFMPLYQSQGAEGFFAIRKVPYWALKLSSTLRKIRLDKLLVLIPGISWADKDTLKVRRSIMWILTKNFFHLMGYRRKRLDRNHYLIKNREISSRDSEYQEYGWYK